MGKWEMIAIDYNKATEALWGYNHKNDWHREEELGRYHMWKAYHEACDTNPKDYLLYARILAMVSDESRAFSSDYTRYHKYVEPSVQAYKIAAEVGQHPTDKELEKIHSIAGYLAYILKCEAAPYDEQIKHIEGNEKLQDFEIYDSHPILFEHTTETARLKLEDVEGITATLRFDGVLWISLGCDPVTNWVDTFYCYPSDGDEDRFTFDIGYYKITCATISVEAVNKC